MSELYIFTEPPKEKIGEKEKGPAGELFSNANKIAELPTGNQYAKQKIETVANDVEKAQETVSASFTLLEGKGKGISALEQELQVKLTDERNTLSYEETIIVNAVATAMRSNPQTEKELDAGVKFYPDINELCVLCARKNYREFAAVHYPELGGEGLDILQEAVKKYLLQKTTVQQLSRALIDVTNLKENKNPKMTKVLKDQLALTLDSRRAYPVDDPLAMILLVLEAEQNIRLRPDQVQNVLKFARGVQEGNGKVLQMLMGAGKTSVLQPILGILFAVPGKLSMIMVPEEQFQDVHDKLVVTLGNAADKCIYSAPYDLELAKDPDYLDSFLKNLKEAQSREACFLLTPRVKYSILTSLSAAYYDATNPKTEDQQGAIERVDKIMAICKFMADNELIQIDEIDMIMNPQVVFKRSIGDPTPYDHDSCQIVSELLFSLGKDERIPKEVSIDFVDKMQAGINAKEVVKKGPPITEKLYHLKVKPKLVDEACRLLGERSGLKTLMKNNKEKFEKFLAHPDSDTPESAEIGQWMRDYIPKEDRKVLAAAAHAIAHVFPRSLLKECNSQYGEDPTLKAAAGRQFIARPYESPDNPKKTMYSDPVEKLAYTAQSTMFNKIPRVDAEALLMDWWEDAQREVKNNRIPIEETKRCQDFKKMLDEHKLSGYSFFVDREEYPKEYERLIDCFQEIASKNPQTLLEFCEKRVFEQVKEFTESATMTPQDLGGKHGYTGTLDEAILASAMKGIPEIGTDGKTIIAVQTKIINGDAEVKRCPSSDGRLTKQVIDQFKAGFSVFIDSGGWLKEEKSMEAFVRTLLDECRKAGNKEVEGVVFHDENKRRVCLEIDERGEFVIVPFNASRLKDQPEKRFTVLAQMYETGTDIKHAPDAKAFMSVRKDMTLRDSLQAMFRMRQVLAGQSVSIGLSDDVQNHISNAYVDGLLSHAGFKELFATSEPITDRLEAAIESMKPLELDAKEKETLRAAAIKYDKSIAGNEQQRVVSFLNAFSDVFEPDSKNIWRYFAINQAKAEEVKHWSAAVHKMHAKIARPVWSILTNPEIAWGARAKLFTTLKEKNFLIESEGEDLFELFTSPPKPTGVDVEIATCVDIVKAALSVAPQEFAVAAAKENGAGDVVEQFEKELNIIGKGVSKKDAAQGKGEAEEESQRQVETLAEEEQQRRIDMGTLAQNQSEKEQETQVRVEPTIIPPSDLPIWFVDKAEGVKGNEYYPTKALVTKIVSSTAYPNFGSFIEGRVGDFVDKRLSCSPNFIRGSTKFYYVEPPKDIAEATVQMSKHLEARYLLACGDGTDTKYMLISHDDYALIKEGIETQELGPTTGMWATVYTLDREPVALTGDIHEAKALAEKEKELFLSAKFATIKHNFSTDEVDSLVAAIGPDQDLQAACRTYYETQIEYLDKAQKEYYKAGNYFGKCIQEFPGGGIGEQRRDDTFIPI
ncbi:MAG: DUF3638 domain-containing protein [Verrucomicrobia bacterium]|nr:DUF3638 domain-containing protein [Verrucomicrobiota bacterium]